MWWGSRYAPLVLERCGNKRQACQLGVSYHTLRAYLSHEPERELASGK